MRLLLFGCNGNGVELLAEQSGLFNEHLEKTESLAEALAALERYCFDGIVVDMDNPGIDGMDLVALVRNVRFAGTGSTVPIVAIGSSKNEAFLEEQQQSGVDRFIVAPLNSTALEDMYNFLQNARGNGGSTGKERHLDPDSVKARLECDDEFLVELWQAFLEESPQLRNELALAIQAEDQSATERRAHSIKGISGNIGAERLRCIAFEIEKFAREGDMTRVADLFPELERSMDFVIGEINALISTK
jgi:HPt (histidine-containing phosphotransfer) domain-containing protein